MGVGSVGSFIAHALRGLPNAPPVTLVFARYEKLTEWNESSRRLTLVTGGDSEIRDGFDAEVAIPRIRYHGKELGLINGDALDTLNMTKGEPQAPQPQTLSGESTEPISSLIICSKAHQVLQGLSSVKHRLHKDSVVCFLHNGMGVVEEVNREIFPDPTTRPHYMLGVNSHSIKSIPSDPFTATHTGFGAMSLGILPHERDRNPDAPYLPSARFTATSSKPIQPEPPSDINPAYPAPSSAKFTWTPTERYLLRTLLRTPVLSAAAFSPPDLLQMQLDKLAVDCIINPLTTMLDARNGSLLNNYALTRTLRLLLSEISLVIRSLPELQYIPNVAQRFDPGRLETIIVSVAHKTRDDLSSMLSDVRIGRQTDIEYVNGWIVKRGEELGIRCLMNYMMVQMVKGKRMVVQREIGEDVPFVGGGEVDVRVGKVGGKKDG
ncbi:6-phosphogluconate dehydrogenase C-terminal domain-like protein [Plenodomus tracheiphilus IPT5]|uniref:6-phosphogluconate dehydrogenase C-terminal domain-like protein n=1 Tax=Plenodomus tracheiphilus IPT5 TaxID=1408161 RepID=A0A6A7BPF2_9PLEO|nr:6-phosphogluconate dehydrogenase C-terminal domain-like protein [Plenodomus tracheiphilus IPT5]